jgi:hypothetical protein
MEFLEGQRYDPCSLESPARGFRPWEIACNPVIVADAGMVSDANMRAIEAEGLSFLLGMRIPEVPYVIDQWHKDNPDRAIVPN